MPNLYEDEHGVIRALVDRLGHDLEPSILIGGWATFVRVGGEISLDIDLITSQESRHKLEQLMTDLSPSNNHQGRKLRATIDNVHLDIYLPYEPQLGGKLRLKVEGSPNTPTSSLLSASGRRRDPSQSLHRGHPKSARHDRWRLRLDRQSHPVVKGRPETRRRSKEIMGARTAAARPVPSVRAPPAVNVSQSKASSSVAGCLPPLDRSP